MEETAVIHSAKFSEEDHSYRDPEKDNILVPSVTQVIQLGGMCSYGMVKKSVLDAKAALGQQAHKAAAYVDLDYEIEDIDPRVKPYLDAYEDLKVKMDWKPLMVENGELGASIAEVSGMLVGFCADRVGMLCGEETVAELKTTSDVGPHMGVQLAGYDLCLGQPEGAPKRRRVVLQLFDDGTFKVWDEKDAKVFHPQDVMAFRGALFGVWFRHNRRIQSVEEALKSL